MALRAFGPLFGQVHGSQSPRVVALHGWGRRGADFDRVLEGMDAVAFDLPGFGATPAPERAMGAAGYAETLVEALDGIGSGPYHLVGHSFGGRVAVAVASTHPELVSSLVLTGVPLVRRTGASRPPLAYRLVRAAHGIGLVSDRRMERIRRARGSVDYRSASGVMRDVLVTVVNESYERELGSITCAVDLVWGADDAEVPVEVAVRAEQLLSAGGARVELTVLPGIGHLTPTEAPDALRRKLDERLS